MWRPGLREALWRVQVGNSTADSAAATTVITAAPTTYLFPANTITAIVFFQTNTIIVTPTTVLFFPTNMITTGYSYKSSFQQKETSQ